MAETKVSLDTNEGSESSLSSIKAIPVTSDPIDIGIITNGSIDGEGIFDVLMRAVDAHIESQWDNDRINGQEYATVYSEAIVATLDRAVNLAVQQLRLGFEIENLRKDGAYKDAQIELAKQQLEKQPYEIKLIEAQTEQVKAQTTNVGATTDRITKETEQKLPAEVKMLTAQVSGIEAENELTGTKVLISKEELKQYPIKSEILGKQKEQLEAQTSGIVLANEVTTYELENKLPLDVALLTKQQAQLDAQIDGIKLGNDKSTYELANKLPMEVELLTLQGESLTAETSLTEVKVEAATAELGKIPLELTLLTKQASQTEAQTEGIIISNSKLTAELEQKLPLELEMVTAQISGIKTENTLTESKVLVAKEELKRYPVELELLSKQKEQLTAQTEGITLSNTRASAELEQKFPLELEMITAQVSGTKAENVLTETKTLVTKEELKRYPVELELLGKQKEQLESQIEGINLANDKATYELANKLPVEVELLSLQGEGLAAETSLTNVKIQATTEELAKIPLEVELLTKQSAQMDQSTTLITKQVEQISTQISKIPHEITILEKQASQLTSQIANTQATTDRMILETEQKLPIEVANLSKQGLGIDAQTKLTENQVEISKLQATVIPVEIEYKQAQIANMGKQNLILEREFEIKLGELALQEKQLELAVISLDLQREELKVKQAQVEGQKAQSELYNQKVITEKAQTDATVIGDGSVIALNNQVLEGQVGAYEFDKVNRAGKLVLDIFATTYAEGDRTVNATNLLRDDELGKLMKVMYTNVGVST